jgi:alpha-amylase/alpha-mannosidase (GH57 family)
MKKKKLAVAILWHQHQPFYKNSSGFYQMPWVRFHGTKDYLDMVSVMGEFPNIKQMINLVPSLLHQISDYAEGAKDNIWVLTEIPADELTPDNKKKILSHFFMANLANMIKPFNRYYDLYVKSKIHLKNASLDTKINAFTVEEYRDLQVWYNLTWIGMESRKRPPIDKLFKKGKYFTEADKQILFEESRKILAEIIPFHQKMWDKGQLELTTTPYYHPILPLLCDNKIGQVSSPGITLPSKHFTFPEDAETQIVKGLKYFEKLFGRKPKGMWPSEGSVSNQVMEIIARQGIDWVATDEGILANSLRGNFSQAKIYQPYLLNMGKIHVNMLFRDHYLSDAIGFVYTNWPAERSVDDFMSRLRANRELLAQKYGEDNLDKYVIPIILDGENCWEYYEGDGKPFLRQLFAALSDDPLVETVTFSEMLQRNNQKEQLNSLHPGSWINSNFNIWIGAEEDNRAWDILYHVRDFLITEEKKGLYNEEVIKNAWEQIYIAEGSDWNWWYGDEHSSENDMEFDQLYREHLVEVYRLLNHDIPTFLYQTIKRVHFDRFESSNPKNFIFPLIDGRSSYFYEWVGAATYDIGKTPQSAMHQVTRILNNMLVGFNSENLFIRLDFFKRPDPLSEFIVAVKHPKTMLFVISPLRGVLEKYQMKDGAQKKTNLKPTFKLNEILEVAIPFEQLETSEGDLLGFQISLKLNNQPLEEFPRMNLVEIVIPGKNFELIEWSV